MSRRVSIPALVIGAPLLSLACAEPLRPPPSTPAAWIPKFVTFPTSRPIDRSPRAGDTAIAALVKGARPEAEKARVFGACTESLVSALRSEGLDVVRSEARDEGTSNDPTIACGLAGRPVAPIGERALLVTLVRETGDSSGADAEADANDLDYDALVSRFVLVEPDGTRERVSFYARSELDLGAAVTQGVWPREPAVLVRRELGGAEREVDVMGFIVRAGDGSLEIHAPHTERGPTVFRLAPDSPALGALRERSSHARRSSALVEVASGGARRDLETSGVVAIVHGTATLVSWSPRRTESGGARTYTIDANRAEVVEEATARRLLKASDEAFGHAARTLSERDDAGDAASTLRAFEEKAREELGDAAWLFETTRVAARARALLAAPPDDLEAVPDAVARCASGRDRTHVTGRRPTRVAERRMLAAICDEVATNAFAWIGDRDGKERTREIGPDLVRVLAISPTKSSLAKPWSEQVAAVLRARGAQSP